MAIKLKYQPPGVHFAVFFGLAVGMFILNLMVSRFFFGDILDVFAKNKDITLEMVPSFKCMQFFGAIMTFVLPPVLYGYMASDRPWNHLGMKKNVSIVPVIAVPLLLISVQPLAMMMGELNSKANFGAMHDIVVNTEAFYE